MWEQTGALNARQRGIHREGYAETRWERENRYRYKFRATQKTPIVHSLHREQQEMSAAFGVGLCGGELALIWMNAGEMDPRAPRNRERQNPLGWWEMGSGSGSLGHNTDIPEGQRR
jgi:hypothetical protein